MFLTVLSHQKKRLLISFTLLEKSLYPFTCRKFGYQKLLDHLEKREKLDLRSTNLFNLFSVPVGARGQDAGVPPNVLGQKDPGVD